MHKIALISLPVLIAGCTSVTPNYDARFGEAVRQAKAAMIINPEAGKNPDQVAGMDGKSARDSIILYQGTFKAPPPAVNVINIGGGLGSADSGTR